MSTSEDLIRIVLVSPGDVVKERSAAKAVVDELNRGSAEHRLILWRWETDARPGLHREGPQGLIDELMELQQADLVIGVFWRRFGTPTHDADSGTEHELRSAWAAWRKRGRPEVMVYFCDRPYTPKTPIEAHQWARVLEFRGQLPSEQAAWTYTKPMQFERLLREHLTRFLRHEHQSATRSIGQRAGPLASDAVRFNTPQVAASFTGREDELSRLDEALRARERVVITRAIVGLGGVGKSQLAARYVQQHASEYDIVAWIRAEDGGTADLADLALRLDVPGDDRSPSELADLALDRLRHTPRRWLLVLDNIRSPEQLSKLRPQDGNGRVIVTSRDRSLRQFARLITLDVFDADAATAYLVDRADRPGDETAARSLAGALGHLPLALSHAAAYCQLGTSFSEYHALLDGLPTRELFDSQPEVSYAQTVSATWHASIEAACAAEPSASAVLEMASYLASDAIPKTLFEVLLRDATIQERKRLIDAFGALARYSLASVQDDTLSVHGLLQKTIRDGTSNIRASDAALYGLAALDERFPHEVESPATWPTCEQLLPHALALGDALTDPGDAGAQLIGLLNRACEYLNCAGRGQRGLRTARATLAHALRILGPEDALTMTTRDVLAAACSYAGQTQEALAIYEALLGDRQTILGVEHLDTLKTRNNLAGVYQARGRVGHALAILEPLLVDKERVLGIEHPDTLAGRHNLASALHAARRIPDAIAILEPLLVDKSRILGADHPSTLMSRNNLAFCYMERGQAARAIAAFEPLLADFERILGVEHPSTLLTRNNVAGAYQAAGRIDQAITVFQSLLADCERVLGKCHPQTLATRSSLALAVQAVTPHPEAAMLRRGA